MNDGKSASFLVIFLVYPILSLRINESHHTRAPPHRSHQKELERRKMCSKMFTAAGRCKLEREGSTNFGSLKQSGDHLEWLASQVLKKSLIVTGFLQAGWSFSSNFEGNPLFPSHWIRGWENRPTGKLCSNQ